MDKSYNSGVLKLFSLLIHIIACWLQVFSGNGNTIDGCATFFRRDRFSHVKKYEVRKKFESFWYLRSS